MNKRPNLSAGTSLGGGAAPPLPAGRPPTAAETAQQASISAAWATYYVGVVLVQGPTDARVGILNTDSLSSSSGSDQCRSSCWLAGHSTRRKHSSIFQLRIWCWRGSCDSELVPWSRSCSQSSRIRLPTTADCSCCWCWTTGVSILRSTTTTTTTTTHADGGSSTAATAIYATTLPASASTSTTTQHDDATTLLQPTTTTPVWPTRDDAEPTDEHAPATDDESRWPWLATG